METILSDGSVGSSFPLTPGNNAPVLDTCIVGDLVWILSEGQRYVTVRETTAKRSNNNHSNSSTNTFDSPTRFNETVAHIDLMCDDARSLCKVGQRVWVSTSSGKLLVLGVDGTLLGVLQPSSIPQVTKMFALPDDGLATCGPGKDLHIWDTTQFTVSQTFSGRTPGEVVTSVSKIAAGTDALLVVGTTSSLRVWSLDGIILAEVQEGVQDLLVRPKDGAAAGEWSLWAAQPGWITIFSLSIQRNHVAGNLLQRDKTLPCGGVRQLLATSRHRVASLDSEGLVTVWDTRSLQPSRSFKVLHALEINSQSGVPASSRLFSKIVSEQRHVVIWTIGGRKSLSWVDESLSAAEDLEATTAEQNARDMDREEIVFLRRKLKCLEAMSTLFRQKTGLLFRDRGHSSMTNLIASYNELEQSFTAALAQWSREADEQEPMRDLESLAASLRNLQGTATDDVVEYWKSRYYEAVKQLSKHQQEHDTFVQLLDEQAKQGKDSAANGSSTPTSAIDAKRAFFICQVLREKNALRENVQSLTDEVHKLRGLLRDHALTGEVSLLDTIEQLTKENNETRQEIAKLRQESIQAQQQLVDAASTLKHNQVLKQRVKSLRTELDLAQLQLTEASASMQGDYQELLNTIGELEQRVQEQDSRHRSSDATRADLELRLTQSNSEAERLSRTVDTLRQELEHRESVEQNTLESVQSELRLMCESLDDRDKRVAELVAQLASAHQQVSEHESTIHQLQTTAKLKDTETFALSDRIAMLESVLLDRQSYGKAVDELQGRMEMVVEELRHGFTPQQLTTSIEELEGRIGSLFALESQLRQKDDLLALRDDEIAQLKEHLMTLEKRVKEVSCVFAKLPRSVEEVEELMVEVDEYRRKLSQDPETQELVQIRLLELKARRNVVERPPLTFEAR